MGITGNVYHHQVVVLLVYTTAKQVIEGCIESPVVQIILDIVCRLFLTLFFQLPYNLNLLLIERATNNVLS